PDSHRCQSRRSGFTKDGSHNGRNFCVTFPIIIGYPRPFQRPFTIRYHRKTAGGPRSESKLKNGVLPKERCASRPSHLSTLNPVSSFGSTLLLEKCSPSLGERSL